MIQRTLAGHLKTHKVITTRDQRLPKFDKTGASNLLMVIVFYNDNVKYNIILSTNVAILHIHCPCNATELCMFIGQVNNYRTCCRFAHITLNRIDPQFDNLLHGQTKCTKHLYNAFAHGCKSIACPNHNNGSTYTPRRKAGCLLLLQSDDVTSKAILHCNSENFPSQLLSKNFEVCSSNDIHIFMRHKHLMFNTLEMQYVLCQYQYMKIEQFSSLDMKGPRNILATTFQGSIA